MPDPTLESQMRVRRKDDVLDTEIDKETVMMDINKGRYFRLNEMGTRIWTELAQPVVIGDLCDRLTAEFNAPPEQCREEVLDFLGNLLSRGMLQIVTDETP
jgi:hypothetical protein